MNSTITISGFHYSRIILIQSLEEHEFSVCDQLAQHIETLQEEISNKIQVEQISCESANEFISIIRKIKTTYSNDSIILQIDCHGDKSEGLVFSNSSVLSWEKFSEEITGINIKTNMGVLLITSACYGFHIMSQNKPFKISPFWGVVAPTDKIDPSEILRALRNFYRLIIKTSTFEDAFKLIGKEKVSTGKWLAEFSERWFEFQVRNFLVNNSNNDEITKRAIKINKEHPDLSIGKIKSNLRSQQKKGLPIYYDKYFLCNIYPDNRNRFRHAHTRIKKIICQLRKQGYRYI